MLRVLSVLFTWLLLTGPALAQCDGRDLRPTLTDAERERLAESLADIPYPQGNHWRATRGDTVVHLVGTIHVGDPRLDAPLARLRPLIADADVVLLEMTRAEEAQLQEAMSESMDLILLADTTLPELMDEPDWTLLADAMRARGMPPFMAAKFQPWYVSMLLAIPPCLANQLQATNGLDKRIEDIADANGIPTRALEPYETGLRAFSDMPLQAQIDMMQTALLPTDATEDQFATLAASYFDERHAEGWAVSAILAERLGSLAAGEVDNAMRHLGERLLDQRNRAWIPVILDAAADSDTHIVAAFGAAHLHGPAGVLRLLEQEGFSVESRPF